MFDVIGSIFGQQQLVVVNYAFGFNQSETGKYFERIIIESMELQTQIAIKPDCSGGQMTLKVVILLLIRNYSALKRQLNNFSRKI